MLIGIERLVYDLMLLGYSDVQQKVGAGLHYAIIPGFIIPAGTFTGRIIGLGLPAPEDYPRSVGSSIQVKADPALFPMGRIIGVRNIQGSGLGADWQYWSFQFILPPANPTAELMAKINEIFRKY
jgi:hypothetical protein